MSDRIAARTSLSARRQKAFLSALEQCGCITRAAEMIGIQRRTHYFWMLKDLEYPVRFAAAIDVATDRLVAEARRRATEGLRRLKFHDGKAVNDPATGEPYVEYEYSDSLLMFLIKKERPEYRERYDVNMSGRVDGRVELQVVERIVRTRQDRIASDTG